MGTNCGVALTLTTRSIADQDGHVIRMNWLWETGIYKVSGARTCDSYPRLSQGQG